MLHIAVRRKTWVSAKVDGWANWRFYYGDEFSFISSSYLLGVEVDIFSLVAGKAAIEIAGCDDEGRGYDIEREVEF